MPKSTVLRSDPATRSRSKRQYYPGARTSPELKREIVQPQVRDYHRDARGLCHTHGTAAGVVICHSLRSIPIAVSGKDELRRNT
jgi:hypothetical protein